MKKSLILAAALAVPAMAGQPCSAPPPCVTPVPVACPYSIEVGAFYGAVTGNVMSDIRMPIPENIFAYFPYNTSVDVYGFDITGVYDLGSGHSLNLRVAYSYGDATSEIGVPGDGPVYPVAKTEYKNHTMSLMPGYRYTYAINEKWSVYAGANVGLAMAGTKLNLVCAALGNATETGMTKVGASTFDMGLAYSAEVGVRYKISECTELFAAYQYMGNTASPDFVDLSAAGVDVSVRDQSYNVIRAGVSVKF